MTNDTKPAGEPRKIRGVFIDTYGSRKAHVREVIDTLPAWYTLLNCETIDNPRVEISGKIYDIIADGEGLEGNGGRPLPSVIGRSGDPLVLGPCFICRGEDSGKWVPLSEEEINDIFAHIQHRRVISPEDTDLDLLFLE